MPTTSITLHLCPKCGTQVAWDRNAFAGAIGPPVVSCATCSTRVRTGWREWLDVPGKERTYFLFAVLLKAALTGLLVAFLVAVLGIVAFDRRGLADELVNGFGSLTHSASFWGGIAFVPTVIFYYYIAYHRVVAASLRRTRSSGGA